MWNGGGGGGGGGEKKNKNKKKNKKKGILPTSATQLHVSTPKLGSRKITPDHEGLFYQSDVHTNVNSHI